MKSFDFDGERVAYQTDGSASAPALVLVNSLGTDLRMWEPQVAAFRETFRVVRWDIPGHGDSPLPPGLLTLERLGQGLVALLDHLGIARADICGISLGGLIAQWCAAVHRPRIRRAILANTAGRIGTVEGWDARIAAVHSGGMTAVRDTVVGRALTTEFRARHPETVAFLGGLIERTPPEGYIAACMVLRDTDLRSVVPQIVAPSLIIAGAFDEATPPAQGEELRSLIAQSELVVLPAAHLSSIECAAAFNEHLLEFLTQR